VPCVRAQLDLAESLHGEAMPATYSSRLHRQATIATSSKLIAEHMEPT
jgi:hypothetical protein